MASYDFFEKAIVLVVFMLVVEKSGRTEAT